MGAVTCADGGVYSKFLSLLWNDTLIVSSLTFVIPPSW